MQFINPRTDFAFKKIFGSAQSKPILLSFLNAVLHDERPVIADLEIIDPYLAPKIQGMKASYVDVRAHLHDGRSVIIEMQVLNRDGFEKRILYNAAKAYSTQLDTGEDYTQLNAVLALTITDFVMFPEHTEVQSAYVLKEKERLTDYPEGDLELVFVELPKFTKPLEELAGVKEQWFYFLRHAPDLKMIPAALEHVPALRAAFAIANAVNLTQAELLIQEQMLDFMNTPRLAVQRAAREGEAKGFELGARAKALAIARQMLGRMTDQEIAAITGLPLADVAALRAEE